MKKLLTIFLVLFVSCSAFAGEDAGLAAGAYSKASKIAYGIGIASTAFTSALDQDMLTTGSGFATTSMVVYIASETANRIASTPTNASFTLLELSEHDYQSLTGKPTAASFTGGVSTDTVIAYIATETANRIASDSALQSIASMSDYILANTVASDYVGTSTFTVHNHALNNLSEKDFSSLAGKPTSASYTLLDLSEHDYQSLTGKPTTASFPGEVSTAALNAAIATETENRISSDGLLLPKSGGTMTGDIVMADGAEIEIATGSASNLSLRFSGYPTTGSYFTGTKYVYRIAGADVVRVDSGLYNVLVGGNIGPNITGDLNTVVGFEAMNQLTSGRYNTAIGRGAGSTNIGNGNCYMGYNSGFNLTGGSDNVILGAYTFGGDGYASASTIVGTNGGRSVTGAAGGNVFVGYSSGYHASQATSVFNSVAVGPYTHTTASNQVVIGNANINDFQIGQGGKLARFTNLATGSTIYTDLTVASNTMIATNTTVTGYDLTVASGAYFGGAVNCGEIIDHSAAPSSLESAYAIVESHESLNGRIDHARLNSAAWGTKHRIEKTGKILVQSVSVQVPIPLEEQEAVAKGEEPVTTKTEIRQVEVEETRMVSEPDPASRNLSMTISAQSLVIKALIKRIEALEAR